MPTEPSSSNKSQHQSQSPKHKKGLMNRIKRYLITGLLVVVPVWGTFLILKTLFIKMDGLLGNIMKTQGLYYLPGLGIVVLLCIIFATGLFATNIFGKKLVLLWEKFLDQVPVVRNIYSMVKSLVDIVSSHDDGIEKFRRVVLLEYPRKGLHTYAFVTGEMRGSLNEVSSERILSVFVPTVPNPISGFIILVPEVDTIPLTITVEETMKIVFSVGLHNPSLHIDETRRPNIQMPVVGGR